MNTPAKASGSCSTLLHVFDSTMTSVNEVLHCWSLFNDHVDTRPRPFAIGEVGQPAGVVEREDLTGDVVLTDHRGGTQARPLLRRRAA